MTTLVDAITTDLRRQIETGDLQPGDRLPSEPELRSRYGTSQAPVRAAIIRLVYAGLVDTRAGAGAFVRGNPYLVFKADAAERNHTTGSPAGPVDTWSRQMRTLNYRPTETREVHHTRAGTMLAALLQVTPGEPLIARMRVRSLDGTAVALADSYYPEWLTRGTRLTDDADIIPGAFAELERLGFGWRHHNDRIRARQPTLEEAKRLGRPPDGMIAFHIIRTSTTGEGKPVRVLIQLLDASYHEIHYGPIDDLITYTVKENPQQ